MKKPSACIGPARTKLTDMSKAQVLPEKRHSLIACPFSLPQQKEGMLHRGSKPAAMSFALSCCAVLCGTGSGTILTGSRKTQGECMAKGDSKDGQKTEQDSSKKRITHIGSATEEEHCERYDCTVLYRTLCTPREHLLLWTQFVSSLWQSQSLYVLAASFKNLQAVLLTAFSSSEEQRKNTQLPREEVFDSFSLTRSGDFVFIMRPLLEKDRIHGVKVVRTIAFHCRRSRFWPAHEKEEE